MVLTDEADERAGPPPGLVRRVAGWSWPSGFPIVQFPNAPLAAALLASLAERFTDGTAHRSMQAIFYLGLGVWAYEETRRGENWFRRLLGLAFSVYLVSELTSAVRS